MFTKEQLAKWESEGFYFDDAVKSYAVDKSKEDVTESKTQNILGYMWCNKTGKSFSKGVLPFGEETIGAIFTFSKFVINKTCSISIINLETKKVVIKNRFIIKSSRVLANFKISEIFLGCENNIDKFRIDINVINETYVSSSKDLLIRDQEILKVHYVILIPLIMKTKKWVIATKSQEDWFLHKGTKYPWESNPRLNYYRFKDWALTFKRFQERYDEKKNVWKSEASINQLKKEISKMIKDGHAEKPRASKKITRFGTSITDGTLVEHKISPAELKEPIVAEIPLFDKYYFTSYVYEESKLFAEIDDFYASIANCTVRFCAKGILEYVNENEIRATITELGIYIRDGFDFVGSQSLGFWSYKEMNVSNSILSNGSYIGINNEDYKKYRADTGMGQDFYTYSTIMITYPDFNFTL
ncbi:hypothetical protein CHU92_12805 [Flavobacterium cyanobacteriorum]|uniref:Uncharacterized protein n=1 Tax=Flavobacterium cyanobacteriorum TaxID=2022802 RepID=A0A255YVJ9_9FLAO|nr:DUF6402 family protein [Flavobacterium cyanobacteriorum]OYQ33267.1 hypothetical protein CHU92_12805 [Flavobacterium cyanobacteriorum]